MKLFDLNIEEVLENWEVHHAIREVISNALDERELTSTQPIEIDKAGDDAWSIRDYGRGLRIEHFTLNENKEKLERVSGVIGKFGVGLKDALATFHRRGVEVEITSSRGTFRLLESSKHGFDAITTLHVSFDDAGGDMTGTRVLLRGVTDEQMSAAKALFLAFNDERVLEATTYGEILDRGRGPGRVYITGVFASEEPNFLFSYNVTNLTDAMRKRLNRERLNVGRTTYADRIRSILRSSTSDAVGERLTKQILGRARGLLADEMQWIEISQLALTRLDEREEVLFVTEKELQFHPDLVDHARADGLRIVIVSTAEKSKLIEQAESGGRVTRTIERYVKEFNESFEYSFVPMENLDPKEQAIFEKVPEILALIGVEVDAIPDIRISETMRLTRDDTEGVWDGDLQAIVVKRSQLRSLPTFAGTLLHEAAHATTGTVDATREFEYVLTRYLGKTSHVALERA